MSLPIPYWREPNFKRAVCKSRGRAIKTVNAWEQIACDKLWRDGYKVYKKGWPDFIAVKDNEIRFIEIKPPRKRKQIKKSFAPDQMRMAFLLKKFFGIQVELWNTYNQFDVDSNEDVCNLLSDEAMSERQPRQEILQEQQDDSGGELQSRTSIR